MVCTLLTHIKNTSRDCDESRNNNDNDNDNDNNNNLKTLLKLHNKILTEIKRKPKEHSSKLLSFKISFSIKHGILI